VFHAYRSKYYEYNREKTCTGITYLVTEKKDGLIKGRHCANGNPQRNWMDQEQVSSPTVMKESTMITSIIEVKEDRDVATCDIPNAFIQTEVEKQDKDGHHTIMKIWGPLVEILCEMEQQTSAICAHSQVSLWADDISNVVLQQAEN